MYKKYMYGKILLIIIIISMLFISGCEFQLNITEPPKTCCEILNLDGSTESCIKNINEVDCSSLYIAKDGYNYYNQDCSTVASCSNKIICASGGTKYNEGYTACSENKVYKCVDGTITTISESCEINASLNVATLKQTYSIGENVLLTDPPISTEKTTQKINLVSGATIFGKIRPIAQYLFTLIISGLLIYCILYLFKNQKKVLGYIMIGVFAIFIILFLVFTVIKPAESLERRWSNFEAKYGGGWDMEENKLTDIPHKIYSSSIEIKENITYENIDNISKDFITKNKYLFKIETGNLDISKIDFDRPLYPEQKEGIVTITYSQTYQEIPVYKSLISLTYINGKLTMATTDYYPGIDISPVPTVTEEEALEIVKKDLGITENIQARNISLWVFPKELDNKVKYYLTWKVEMPVLLLKTNKIEINSLNQETSGQVENNLLKSQVPQPEIPVLKPSQWVYFIDAHTGIIIYSYNNIIY